MMRRPLALILAATIGMSFGPARSAEDQPAEPDALPELEAMPPPAFEDKGVKEAPLAPKVRAPGRPEEPSVTIRQEDDKLIEEYTQAGRIVMVRITPKVGPAYYLLDSNGDGELDRREDDLGSVGPVYWKLKEW